MIDLKMHTLTVIHGLIMGLFVSMIITIVGLSQVNSAQVSYIKAQEKTIKFMADQMEIMQDHNKVIFSTFEAIARR